MATDWISAERGIKILSVHWKQKDAKDALIRCAGGAMFRTRAKQFSSPHVAQINYDIPVSFWVSPKLTVLSWETGDFALDLDTDYPTHAFHVMFDREGVVASLPIEKSDKLHWGESDPLFPATQLGLSAEGGFTPVGLCRNGWNSAGPIRAIFRTAFERASLPYFNPHSFRNTLVQLGEKVCTTPESFKAWSQNLGHEGVLTTLTSYGQVSPHRQAVLIRGMGTARVASTVDPAIAAQVIALMEQLSGRA